MTKRFLSLLSASGRSTSGPHPGSQPTTGLGPIRSIDIGAIIISNCNLIEPKARFNFVTQLSDNDIWTVNITRSLDGICDVFLSASGSSPDDCFDHLFSKSSQATSHHINNLGFEHHDEIQIEPETEGESDRECDAQAGMRVNRADAHVTDDESDWGDGDCEGPASFVSVVPSQSPQARSASRKRSRSTRSRKLAPLASLVPLPPPPPPRSSTPPPPPLFSKGEIHYDDPPPPPPPPTMRSSLVVSSALEKKPALKPRPACLLIEVLEHPGVTKFIGEVLPSQKDIERETMRLIDERGLAGHIEDKSKLKRCFTISTVALGADPGDKYDFMQHGDDLSALFDACGNFIPRFHILIKHVDNF